MDGLKFDQSIVKANALLECYFLAQLAEAPNQDNYLIEGLRLAKQSFKDAQASAETVGVSLCRDDRACTIMLDEIGTDGMVGTLVQQVSENVSGEKFQALRKQSSSGDMPNPQIWASGEFNKANCELILQ